ncbi:MAG: 50S ribosomal protein L6 [Parcubacteria group bacterium GW2011_GWA2_44_12]|nr:MAG: 50S ribosomal protein L6 [Parcubacteria group bacterium GW2011_GWA2_44_12]
MSRITKKPIQIPQNVEITAEADNLTTVKGPLGELQLAVPLFLKLDQEKKGYVSVLYREQTGSLYALWGTYHRLLTNAILGVTKKFEKKLEINGVGYKAALKGRDLELWLGFSHTVIYKIPEGIEVQVEKNILTISGIDKQKVGQTAAEVRRFKRPDPYKKKGIKYIDEIVKQKVGKKVKSSSG